MSAKRTALFALMLATALPVGAAGNPAALLRTFLDTHGNQSGLPTGDKVAAIQPFLSEALNEAMARARKEQEAFIARHPDEKPPWIEGPLFHSSGAEPFTAYAIVLPAGGCPDTRCVIRVDMVDTVASPDVLWHDEFVVVQEDGGWRVDDVNYRAGFEFGNHGSLRTNLEADPAE
ncbi:hypothetical protein [Arenimonas daejeonensis]|uniref:hypothetical protein n=1 Tax=Arenimonas daejeonensis TaxID=370777 RepID=UPI0011BE4AB7|nr:hypothetical protein [Arenimonas daejeonensis]